MTELDISDNRIGEHYSGKTAGAQALSAAIKGNACLKKLNLSSNGFLGGDATFLADGIRGSGAILSVNLLKNDIGVEQARALAIILKEHSALKSLCGNSGEETELDMSGKMNGAEDVIMLAAEIIDNGAMTSLNLASNMIGSEGAKHVAEAIRVSVLRLFWYQFHAHLTNGSTAVVCHCPQDMRAILSVNLLENNIGTGPEALATILKEHPTLKSLCGNTGDETELDMSGTKMGAEGAIMLAAEIIGNGAMTSLNLANNKIGEFVPAEGWQYDEEDDQYSKTMTQEQEPPKEAVEVYVDGWEYDEQDNDYWKDVTQEQEPPKETVEVYVDGWQYDEDDGSYWRDDEDGEQQSCTEEPEKEEKEQYVDGWEYEEEEKVYQKTVTQKEEPATEDTERYVDGWEYNTDSALYTKTVVQSDKPMAAPGVMAIANAIKDR
jgi:hypothetical protein